jgi:hypothetical protein
MGKEPDNLVLTLLPEISTQQDEQNGKIDAVDGRRHLETQLELTATYTLSRRAKCKYLKLSRARRLTSSSPSLGN